MAKIGRHVYVSGRVQGVAFRYSAIRQAHLLCHRVGEKCLDGRVELLIEGEDTTAVGQMIDWCHQGRVWPYVTQVQEDVAAYSGKYPAFDVRF